MWTNNEAVSKNRRKIDLSKENLKSMRHDVRVTAESREEFSHTCSPGAESCFRKKALKTRIWHQWHNIKIN